MSEKDRLVKLMMYFWQGSEILSESERPLLSERSPISRSELARSMNVSTTSVRRWLGGGPIDKRGKKLLAAFCDCTIEELDSYLQGRMELVQLLQQKAGQGKVEKQTLILALQKLSTGDLIEFCQVALALLSSHVGDVAPISPTKHEEAEFISWALNQSISSRKRIVSLLNQTLSIVPIGPVGSSDDAQLTASTDTQKLTLSQLIATNLSFFGDPLQEQAQIAKMAQTASIEPDELQALLNGARPNQKQLIALTRVLKKPGSNDPIGIEELQRIHTQSN